MAPELLRRVPLAGCLVTGDALYCQRALCRQIRDAAGDYLFAIKANQPDLLSEVSLLFTDPPPDEAYLVAQHTQLHGDRLEERTLRASAALNAYLATFGWPDVGLVIEVERAVRWPTKPDKAPAREVRYFLTSLPATAAPDAVLHRVRQHWAIENRLHYPRDVTLGEDACRVRAGSAPLVLAALRNTVLGVLRQRGWTNMAAGLRRYAWGPVQDTLRLLGITAPT